MTRSRRCSIFAGLIAILQCCAVNAHDLGIGRLNIEVNDEGRLSVEVRTSANLDTDGIELPKRCAPDGASVRTVIAGDDQYTWHYQCGAAIFNRNEMLVLSWPLEGLFVSASDGLETAEGRFHDAVENRIVVPLVDIQGLESDSGGTFGHYLKFGVEHILSGWDHLAFVLALVLIASGWRLIKLVTAFTVGHSITLAAAAAGMINVPAPPLEACIALSIAFIAREALLNRKDSHGYLIVLGFGLLHGLGFARALGEAGVAAGDLLAALLAFNLGVEVGQLLFVFAIVLLGKIAAPALQSVRTRNMVAYALGSLGLFWTIERTTLFFS